MATAEEFEELLRRYETEQEPSKKAAILEKMRANVLERNGNSDVFKTLYTNRAIRISQAGLSELIEISRNMEALRKQQQREVINEKARKEQTERKKYTQKNPYPYTDNLNN